MTKVVCRFCIAANGLRGADLANWPDEKTPGAEEWLYHHIESVHHMPVTRDGETREQAQARFFTTYPLAGTDACRCPACEARRSSAVSEK